MIFLVVKGDSMRKLIHHIDQRNWRTIDYFRMLDKKKELELDKDKVGTSLLVIFLIYFIEIIPFDISRLEIRH